MEKKFIIEARYEFISSSGKQFTDWYIYDHTERKEDEALNQIKLIKKEFSFIDTKTKLNHEYRIKDYNEYLNELEELKTKNKELKIQQEKYFKSEEYKELQKKKRQAKKELKERQKKYLEEHTKS